MRPDQRFRRASPCPVCGGHDALVRGKGKRCHGFLSSDSRYAHCTRPEHAGRLELKSGSESFSHRLDGPCDCGVTHGPLATRPRSRRDRVLHDQNFSACTWPYPCDYFDENGRMLRRVARWPNPGGMKRITQHSPDGPGNWLPRVAGVRHVVYQLPETRVAIEAGGAIHVPEGEKKVHLLLGLGFHATCNDGGAGKWRPEHTAGMHGARRVVVWADNDTVGLEHAELVAHALHEAGVPDIRVPLLAGLAEGEGIDDWLARRKGHGASEEELRIELELLINATAPWRLVAVGGPPGPVSAVTPEQDTSSRGPAPSGPFAKVYRSLWDGTLGPHRNGWNVFVFLLAHCDAAGIVELTPEAIAARSGVPLEDVADGIAVLEGPDPRSRSRVRDGRRIVRLDQDRDWGWQIVNYAKYRDMSPAQRNARFRERHRDEIRESDRERKRRVRDDVPNVSVTVPNASATKQRQKQRQKRTDKSTGRMSDGK